VANGGNVISMLQFDQSILANITAALEYVCPKTPTDRMSAIGGAKRTCGATETTLAGRRNVPLSDLLTRVERSRKDVALHILTAIAVLALLSYLV
jgi:hypothetical protein